MKSLCRETKDIIMRVGIHQDSALSTNLFFLVIDDITKDIQNKIL